MVFDDTKCNFLLCIDNSGSKFSLCSPKLIQIHPWTFVIFNVFMIEYC